MFRLTISSRISSFLRATNRVVKRGHGLTSARSFSGRSTPMLCMQCEQTSHGTGCTTVGICGKIPETAGLQDLLLTLNNELSRMMATSSSSIPTVVRKNVEDHLLESTFSTLTNVNFDEDRMIDYIMAVSGLHQEVSALSGSPTSDLAKAASTGDEDVLLELSIGQGLETRRATAPNIDVFGLREMAQYGMKGTMAYLSHCETIRADFPGVYSDEEREKIFDQVFQCSGALTNQGGDMPLWLQTNLGIGALNVEILELLDRSHRTAFGSPSPQVVSGTPVEGKAICISGHDIADVYRVLKATQGTGISVYTHGELLPAHGYPKVNEFEHLRGHFGSAWQNQFREFKDFPGPILMTSNCLMPPRRRYKDRLFTSNAVGYHDIKHIDISTTDGMAALIDFALSSNGFSSDDCRKIAERTNEKTFTTGFGHEAVLSHADTILSAIKSGDLEHVFVIGGCDGTEKSRSYFTELTKATPEKSVVLTAGCGKYRVFEAGLGELGNTGLPRVLDLGQCNDSYSGVVVALKLAEALEVDVHDLPLHFAISWFEQKAVACLLSLLHLGFKNIRIGPALPAFVSPNVLTYLNENLGLNACNLEDERADMEMMISGK